LAAPTPAIAKIIEMIQVIIKTTAYKEDEYIFSLPHLPFPVFFDIITMRT
jgi:hypothetical protein